MYKTQWDLANAHVNQILPILKVMGDRGIRLDKEKLEKFNEAVEAEIVVLQQAFDADVVLQQFRPLHPKHKDGTFGYKRVPKDISGMVLVEGQVALDIECEICGGSGLINCTATCSCVEIVQRWCKLLPFKATSPNQVKAYINAMGHKMPTVKDEEAEGGKKETTNAKALALLWRRTGDDHYRQFVEMRKLVKLGSTYGKWPLTQRDGEFFVATTFTLKPDTSRLSSVNPNIQNIPKGK